MEKPHRMAQIYGYTTCLVAVITFLICLANLIPAIMDLGDPLHSGNMFIPATSPSLASFENYKMDILKSNVKEGEKSEAGYIPDDQTLRAMYQAALNDRITAAKHNTNRTIVVSGLILVISVILFAVHWIWMRRLAKTATAA